jgi:hypothetical protein
MEGLNMSMIGTRELDRAEFEDAEVARTFAFHSNAARDRAEGQERSSRFAPAHAGFSHIDAVAMPGVRMFPSGGLGTA